MTIPSDESVGALRIGEVARRSGLTADTVRYYERLGLVGRAARTAGGYRLFPVTVLNRLQVIRNAQGFGFSLAEIRTFLRVRDAGRPPCRLVRDAAEARLRDVDARIRELAALRNAMSDTLASWSKRLDETPEGKPARLLEDLTRLDSRTRRLFGR